MQAVIFPGSRVGAGCRLRRVVIDKGCTLPEGLVVGENADEDAPPLLPLRAGHSAGHPGDAGQAVMARMALPAKTAKTASHDKETRHRRVSCCQLTLSRGSAQRRCTRPIRLGSHHSNITSSLLAQQLPPHTRSPAGDAALAHPDAEHGLHRILRGVEVACQLRRLTLCCAAR